MKLARLNRFCTSLKELCQSHPITEKWLLAPSLRIGLAWMDAVVRSGQPVVNLQVVTISRLARNMIRSAIEEHGLRFTTQSCEEVLVGRVLAILGQDRQGYLTRLRPNASLVRAVGRSIREIRMSELTHHQMDLEAFEIHTKGRELQQIVQEYDRLLEKHRWVDDAKCLRMATKLIQRDPSNLPRGLLLIKSEDMVFSGIEQTFWRSFPKSVRMNLPIDLPRSSQESTSSEIVHPKGYGSNQIFRAIGFAAEIREVIRRCFINQIQIDQVEILYTHYQTYVPVIYELLSAESIPVSFSEGIPARAFRPGRALLSWIQWIRQGFLENTHHQMQIEGLLREDVVLEQNEFHSTPYPRSILSKAKEFLRHQVRGAGKLEEYSRQKLIEQIQELIECLEEEEQPDWLDIWAWLAELPDMVRVGGEGPRPGHLYVTPLEAGGHSARSHTFIVGLDDSRFPGLGLQDPLLLDEEKTKLSSQLQTSIDKTSMKIKNYQNLMARLQGQVHLSYSCCQLQDEKDLFSSQPVQNAKELFIRKHKANSNVDHKQPIATYGTVPNKLEKCLNQTEWWLFHLCTSEPPKDPLKLVMEVYPHLERGDRAKKSRESAIFTEYDGFVPEAGKRYDPFGPTGMVLSAGQLETMGTCPMEFFFRHVLEVELPPIYQKKDWIWLDPTTRGLLLHEVFCEFLTNLQKEGKNPQLDRDWKLMQKILRSHLEKQKSKVIPTNLYALEQEIAQLESVACIFLKDQETICKDSRPTWLEVSVGTDRRAADNTLDSTEPVVLPLPSGNRIRVRGTIDRVDQDNNDPLCFSVIDYKTGTAWKYRQDPPFCQGRIVQNALYACLVQALLHKRISPSAKVKSFGYYFPATNECGLELCWNTTEMTKGLEHIDRLCRLITMGCFPFTNDPKDVAFSDYRPVFGDLEESALHARAKLFNPKNQELEPLRALRDARGKEKPDETP